jgi:hypothetical protein
MDQKDGLVLQAKDIDFLKPWQLDRTEYGWCLLAGYSTSRYSTSEAMYNMEHGA